MAHDLPRLHPPATQLTPPHILQFSRQGKFTPREESCARVS